MRNQHRRRASVDRADLQWCLQSSIPGTVRSTAQLLRFHRKGQSLCSSYGRSHLVLVFQSEQSTILKEELAAPLRVMQEIARRIAKVSKESKLPIVEDDYVSSFKVELMDAVVQWCRGASFSEICKVNEKSTPTKIPPLT